jgi:hypothetical protein
MKLDYLNHSKFKNYLLDFNQKLESLEGISLTLKSYNRFLKDHNYLFYISSEDGNKIPVIPIDFYLKEVGSNKQYFFKYHLFNETFEVQANKSFTVKKPNDKLWDKLVTKYFNLINASFQESNNLNKTNESENKNDYYDLNDEKTFLNNFKPTNISSIKRIGDFLKVFISALLFGLIIFLLTSFYNIIPRPKIIFENIELAETILEIVFGFYVVIIYKTMHMKTQFIWMSLSYLKLHYFVMINLIWFFLVLVAYYNCSIMALRFDLYGLGMPDLPMIYYVIFIVLSIVEFDIIRINSKHIWWRYRIVCFYELEFILSLFNLNIKGKENYNQWIQKHKLNVYEITFLDKVMTQFSKIKFVKYDIMTMAEYFITQDSNLNSPYPTSSIIQKIHNVYSKIKESIS